jgi:hypothetical protein
LSVLVFAGFYPASATLAAYEKVAFSVTGYDNLEPVAARNLGILEHCSFYQ